MFLLTFYGPSQFSSTTALSYNLSSNTTIASHGKQLRNMRGDKMIKSPYGTLITD